MDQFPIAATFEESYTDDSPEDQILQFDDIAFRQSRKLEERLRNEIYQQSADLKNWKS